jgi:hypothetical protein
MVGNKFTSNRVISFLKAREIGMRVPFNFFETATFVYDYQGRPVRTTGGKKATN